MTFVRRQNTSLSSLSFYQQDS